MASSANIDDHLDNFTEAFKGISIAPAYELALFVFTLTPSYRKVVFEDNDITDLNGAVSAGRSMQVAKGASSAHHHHASQTPSSESLHSRHIKRAFSPRLTPQCTVRRAREPWIQSPARIPFAPMDV